MAEKRGILGKIKDFAVGKKEQVTPVQLYSKSQRKGMDVALREALKMLNQYKHAKKHETVGALGKRTINLGKKLTGGLEALLSPDNLIQGGKTVKLGDKISNTVAPYLLNEQNFQGGVNAQNPVDLKQAQDVALNAFNPYEEHALKQFQQNIVPTIAERFASLGSGQGGSQRSSSFQQALGNAGSDLASQLAAMRAQYGQNQQGINQNEQRLGLQQQGLNQNLLNLLQGQQRLGMSQQGINQRNIGLNQNQQRYGLNAEQFGQNLGNSQQQSANQMLLNLLNVGLNRQTDTLFRPETHGVLGGLLNGGIKAGASYLSGGLL